MALNGFKAQAWNRSEKNIEGVDCFFGDQGLDEILPISDVLINCLPLNQGTHHFLNSGSLGKLPTGSFLINVSRGAVIDDQALISLLDVGHVAAAALDAFAEEPLPDDSPFWGRDNVFITPHMAGGTYAESAAKVIVDNIIRIENGDQPFPIYHRQ